MSLTDWLKNRSPSVPRGGYHIVPPQQLTPLRHLWIALLHKWHKQEVEAPNWATVAPRQGRPQNVLTHRPSFSRGTDAMHTYITNTGGTFLAGGGGGWIGKYASVLKIFILAI